MAKRPLTTVPLDDLYEGDKIRLTTQRKARYTGQFVRIEKEHRSYWLYLVLKGGSRLHAVKTSDIVLIERVK